MKRCWLLVVWLCVLLAAGCAGRGGSPSTYAGTLPASSSEAAAPTGMTTAASVATISSAGTPNTPRVLERAVLPLEAATEARTPEIEALFRHIADLFAARPGLRAEIHAYTWNVGRSEKNLERTYRQAGAVKNVLVGRYGLAPTRLEIHAHGDSHPLATNTTPEGRSQNRRVEIVLLDPTASPTSAGEQPPQAEPRELRLILPFASAQTVLATEHQNELHPLLAFLARYPAARVTLIGHTDNIGDTSLNEQISRYRAEHIRHLLVKNHGVDPARISVTACGEERPVADNETPEGRERNRRVEVVVRCDESPAVTPATSVATAPARPLPEASSPVPEPPAGEAVMLYYHGFDMGTSTSIPTAQFERQIDYMLSHGFNIISIEKLAEHLEKGTPFPPKTVVIGMDDGWHSKMRGFEVLKKHDLPFTIFLAMQYVGHEKGGLLLSATDLETLKSYPKVTFANHSYSHSEALAAHPLRNPSAYRDFVVRDIERSKARFRELFGYDTPFFAYPFGAMTATYTQALREAGFTWLFSTIQGPIKYGANRDRLPRVAAHCMSLQTLAGMFPDIPARAVATAPSPQGTVTYTPLAATPMANESKAGQNTAPAQRVAKKTLDFSLGYEPPTPTQSKPVSQAAPAAQPPVEVCAVGDIMLGAEWPRVLPAPGTEQEAFAAVKPFLTGHVVFGNLEGPLIDSGTPVKCADGAVYCHEFRSPTRIGRQLREAGFNALSVANNHAYDFGEAGMRSTIMTLDGNGIEATGGTTVANLWPLGRSVVILGFSPAERETSYSLLNITQAQEVVREACAKYDLVIVSFHGGAEGEAEIEPGTEFFQGENRGDVIRFAHAVVDAGADLVLGHGPHVLRAMELYKDRLIAYSLGNFIGLEAFSTRGARGRSVVLQARLDRLTGVFLGGRLVPLRLSDKGVPVPDEGGKAIELVRHLTQEDVGSVNLVIAEDGSLQVTKSDARVATQAPHQVVRQSGGPNQL